MACDIYGIVWGCVLVLVVWCWGIGMCVAFVVVGVLDGLFGLWDVVGL